MTNVVALRPPAHQPDDHRLAALIDGFVCQRRARQDVFWLKENAELLGALASGGTDVPLGALAPWHDYYTQIERSLRDFPQYYRFILSIGLDLEALGMPGTRAEALCAQTVSAGLAEAELSDLQRAEARRLLTQRGQARPVGHGALGARLRRFITRSETFATPNKKAAYELTHIVFYLSDYGRITPELDAAVSVSLEYAGLLAFLDRNMDLLAEVCAALRFAGQVPSPVWEAAVAAAHGAFVLRDDAGADLNDGYHEWLLTGWSAQIAQRGGLQASVPGGALRFGRLGQGARDSALRPMAACICDMGPRRSGDWGRMRPHVMSYLDAEAHAVLVEAEGSTTRFGSFFEGFARAEAV